MPAQSQHMLPDIEEIVTSEMSGLCSSCVHHDECVYRVATGKVVIQCEVFESDTDNLIRSNDGSAPKGLCLNCSKRHFCHLPKETSGVWHCEEYE